MCQLTNLYTCTSTVLFKCDFESYCPFNQKSSTQKLWWYIGNSGDNYSPDTGTGPDVDHTTGTGKYIFLDATDGRSGEYVDVVIPDLIVKENCIVKIEFYYSMYGAAMGELGLVEGNSNTFLFRRSGQQHSDGSMWSQYTRTFDPKPGQGTVKFIFIGQTGSGDTGDMALDDISFVEDCSQAAARQSYQTVGEFVRILQIFCI